MSPPPIARLLVVDDEPDLRTLYELTLLREGYDVQSAATVEEGWALLQEHGPGGFQLVITDMRLPDGTGLDLLRRIDETGGMHCEANYAVFRTKLDGPSTVYNVGRYIDTVVHTPAGLKFAQRLCIYDSEMIPNAIIYPI